MSGCCLLSISPIGLNDPTYHWKLQYLLIFCEKKKVEIMLLILYDNPLGENWCSLRISVLVIVRRSGFISRGKTEWERGYRIWVKFHAPRELERECIYLPASIQRWRGLYRVLHIEDRMGEPLAKSSRKVKGGKKRRKRRRKKHHQKEMVGLEHPLFSRTCANPIHHWLTG